MPSWTPIVAGSSQGSWHLSVMRSPVALPPSRTGSRAMQHRRRLKETTPLKERLAAVAQDVRDQAAALPPGAEREDLLRRARQADTASHLDEWINSPVLQPPA